MTPNDWYQQVAHSYYRWARPVRRPTHSWPALTATLAAIALAAVAVAALWP